MFGAEVTGADHTISTAAFGRTRARSIFATAKNHDGMIERGEGSIGSTAEVVDLGLKSPCQGNKMGLNREMVDCSTCHFETKNFSAILAPSQRPRVWH